MLPVNSTIKKELKVVFDRVTKWRTGYFVIGGLVLARWLGLFSGLELATLDLLLRYRPAEKKGERIAIVQIETDSFHSNETMSDGQIVELLEIILSAKPAVVGLNVFRGKALDQNERDRLIRLFEIHDNLIGVEKALPPGETPPIPGIPERIVEEQFGINDVLLDRDGRIRRALVGAYPSSENNDPNDSIFKFSFSFRLAEKYLESWQYSLENYPPEPELPSFRKQDTEEYIKIPKLNPNSGAYVREQSIAVVQTMLNFRAGNHTFDIFDSDDLLNGRIDSTVLSNRVVIVGRTDKSLIRYMPVAAISNLFEEEELQRPLEDAALVEGILGSELEAHAASQIISTVLDGRPLIQTFPFFIEDLLIIASGLAGIAIAIFFESRTRTRSALALLISVTLVVCSGCLLMYRFGFWLPLLPMAACLAITGTTYLALNYRSQREALLEQRAALLEAKVLETERRKAIERAFSTIHAGPLQRLSGLLRSVKDGYVQQDFILTELRALNKEIRSIGERLRQEAIEDVYFVHSQSDIKLDLTHPMHEVLYEVYSLSVQRKLPGFEKVKVRSVSIEPFNCKLLNLDLKRQLCWFLEESLQNIGKHASGATRIQVIGKHINDFYSLRIEDNGPGIQSTHIGDGTQAFYRLELALRGKFSRFSKTEGGTVCELSWPSFLK